MLTVNELEPDRHFGVAIELWTGALLTSGREVTGRFAERLPVPVIGVAASRRPPDDTGDWLIVPDHLAHRARSMMGVEIARLLFNVGMYALVKGG
jgi:hypothetical protein